MGKREQLKRIEEKKKENYSELVECPFWKFFLASVSTSAKHVLVIWITTQSSAHLSPLTTSVAVDESNQQYNGCVIFISYRNDRLAVFRSESPHLSSIPTIKSSSNKEVENKIDCRFLHFSQLLVVLSAFGQLAIRLDEFVEM